MTKQEAKDISIEVWQYLADHPEIHDKTLLPERLLKKIGKLIHMCPLCELFTCPDCPLDMAGMGCCLSASPYQEWNSAVVPLSIRQQAAQKIVDIVKAWKVEETA